MTSTEVYRPALNVIQTGGSFTIVDVDGNVQQIIGEQPDGTVGITHQNGAPPPAVSTPVVTDATLGLTVTWDGLLADQQPGPTLNANSDFETGVDSWTVSAGAALTQSATEAHGGTNSALLTPGGGSSTESMTSELVAVTAQAAYQVSGWAWLTDAVTDGFSLSVDWYDSASQLLSTVEDLGDLAAAEWSEILNTVTAPDGAAFASITATLTTGDPGTPIDAEQLLYLDDVALKPVTLDTPADFDHVEVHVSESSGFTPDGSTLAGTLTHAGSFPVTPLEGGTEYFVRLVGVNTSGIGGDPSTQASGTPTEVVATSADFTARDIGGITTSVGATKPTGALASDIWIDTGNGNRFNQYDGTDWVPLQWDTGSLKAASVTADVIAAATILGENIAAETITGDNIAANAIVAGLIDAGAVTADKLAAVLVLATQLVAGDAAGARVQLDETGINAYDAGGNNTVMIGADGNAIFRGSSVSASEIDATNVVITAGDNGALLMYGQNSAALNTNPDMLTGITGWTAGTNVTISYSSTHQFNGHNTLRMVCSVTVGDVMSATVSGLTPGNPYTFDVLALLSDNSTIVTPEIVWKDSGGHALDIVSGNPIGGGRPGNWTAGSVTAIAPTGAVQASLELLFSSPSAGAAYIAHAALSGPGLVASLSPSGGTDQYGTDYPAGLAVAGGVDFGPVCRLITTSTKGLSSLTTYVVSWDSAEYDTALGDSWSPAAPTRFACTKAGIYQFVGTANMLAFSARLIINFQKNGTTLNGRAFGWSGASRTTAQYSRQIQLDVGDYVEMVVENTAASDSTMPVGGGDQPSLDVTYLHS